MVDADLADYFGSLSHPELMRSVARRVVDQRLLRLIKMWLEGPVQETEAEGRQRMTTESRDQRRGVPKGSPLSPLLANLYMRRLVLALQQRGSEDRYGKVVTYADDLVICCPPGETFDFFGNNFSLQYWIRTGRPYLGLQPSRKSI